MLDREGMKVPLSHGGRVIMAPSYDNMRRYETKIEQ
jgi:hypothetical protein